MFYVYILLLLSFVPFYSIQHFIWPLHWCLLADICNHTWIPECGTNDLNDIWAKKIFSDECDLFEYNCDFMEDYIAINYSDCFNLPPRPCPKIVPCPSRPTCPDHRYHRMGQKYVFVTSRRRETVIPPRRTFPTLPKRTSPSLPAHMLHGKRRYMSFLRKQLLEELKVTASMKIQNNKKKTKPLRTVVVKKELFVKNGKTYVKKFVKGIVTTLKKPKKAKRPLTGKDSGYLE